MIGTIIGVLSVGPFVGVSARMILRGKQSSAILPAVVLGPVR